MSYLGDKDFYLEVEKGNVAGHSITHKFGRNSSVPSNAFVPITPGGIWLTPQVAGATTLRVKAGNVNDTAAGSGARSVTVIGLDETGVEVEETLATAGTSASAATSATFIRLYRAFVKTSGSYAALSVGAVVHSHAADIVIENGGGGTDWTTIERTTSILSRAQTQIACYSIPLGFDGYLHYVGVNVEGAKTASIVIMTRQNILDTTVPYSAMRLHHEFTAIGNFSMLHGLPDKLPSLTDIIFLGKASATADISVDFDIIKVAT